MSIFVGEAVDEQEAQTSCCGLSPVSPLPCTQLYALLSSSPFVLISLLKASRPTLVVLFGPLLTWRCPSAGDRVWVPQRDRSSPEHISSWPSDRKSYRSFNSGLLIQFVQCLLGNLSRNRIQKLFGFFFLICGFFFGFFCLFFCFKKPTLPYWEQ